MRGSNHSDAEDDSPFTRQLAPDSSDGEYSEKDPSESFHEVIKKGLEGEEVKLKNPNLTLNGTAEAYPGLGVQDFQNFCLLIVLCESRELFFVHSITRS